MTDKTDTTALTADAQRLANVADQVRALEPEGSEEHLNQRAAKCLHRADAAHDPAFEKPEAGRYVLAWTEGAKVPIRAMWAPQFFLEMAEDDAETGEYSEEKDQYFCPAGWYENNAHEETHWSVSTPVVAWMELPRRSPALQAAPPAPAAVAVPAESALVPIVRLKNARAVIDRGFWNEGSKILDELIAAAPAQEHATQLAGQGAEVIENLLRLAQIVDRAVEDWGESFADGSCEVKFHKDEADKMEAILEFFDSLPDAPEDEGVIESGPLKAARAIRAAVPAQAQEDARDLEAEALRACSDLPEGWDIVIHLEKGSGSVVLIDPEFNESDVALDGSLFDALKESIDQAVQAGAARAAQGGA